MHETLTIIVQRASRHIYTNEPFLHTIYDAIVGFLTMYVVLYVFQLNSTTKSIELGTIHFLSTPLFLSISVEV